MFKRLRTFIAQRDARAFEFMGGVFESQDRARRIDSFINEVNLRIKKFGWNPRLPELKQLKARAADHIDNPMSVLSELDPTYSTKMQNGCLILFERPFGRVMRPWHIAERLISGLHDEAHKIVASYGGTTIFNRHGKALVTFMAGSINPNRLGDPGNRYCNAALIMQRYSGRKFNAMPLVGRVHTITIARQDNGRWAKKPVFKYVAGRELVLK